MSNTNTKELQWYTTNKELFEAEILAMNDFKPDARYGFLEDGRMYWSVSFTPNIVGRRTKKYNLALVYDSNHPKGCIRVYLIKPTIDDLRAIVIKMPGITDKSIPHTFKDCMGNICLSCEPTCVYECRQWDVIVSAATWLRGAMRWVSTFELGLLDLLTWKAFHYHGDKGVDSEIVTKAELDRNRKILEVNWYERETLSDAGIDTNDA